MLAYQADAEAHGAVVAFESPLERAEVDGDGIVLEVGGAEPMQLLARVRGQQRRPARAGPGAALLRPRPVPAAARLLLQGQLLRPRRPLALLAADLPRAGAGGLGVHVTIDLAGRCRFGPDTEWVEEIHYPVDPARADAFYAEVRKYWPGLPDGALVPDYAGHPAEARPGGTPAARLRDRRPGRARRPGPGGAVRDREPGPHRFLADSLRGRSPAGPAGPREAALCPSVRERSRARAPSAARAER